MERNTRAGALAVAALFMCLCGQAQSSDTIPDDMWMFVRPPIAAPETPQLVSSTDSSIHLNFSFDPTTTLTKAVDVTNVTFAPNVTELTGGNYFIDVNEPVGLNSSMAEWLSLHSIFEEYLMNGLSLSLPMFIQIPEGKTRIFLRKPVKRFDVQMLLKAKPGMDFDEVGKWETMVTLDTVARECEIEGLHPGALYVTRVCSANSNGVGKCSEEVEMKTADVPSKPGKVRKGKSTSSSLQVVVMRPVYTNGAELTEITLEMGRKAHGPWTRLPYDMAVARKMIKDLEPGSLYFFRSRAWNKVGPSSWSDPAEFETDSMVPKKIPKVELVGQRADKLLATTDVDLAWNTSDPRGRPIRDYLLEKAMGYDKSDENFNLECLTESQNCTVTGLKAGKMYHFRVAANNAIGRSKWSDYLEIIAAPAVTLAPGPVELKEGGTRSLEVSFDRPSDYRGSPPKYYLIQTQEIPPPKPPINMTALMEKGPVDMEALKAMAPKPVYWNDVYKGLDTRVVITKFIRPAQAYKFRVHALNAVGVSEWSEESTITTQVTTPDAPDDLTATAVDTTSMTLQWSKPAGNGAKVKKYRLKMAKMADVQAFMNYSNNNSTSALVKEPDQEALTASKTAPPSMEDTLESSMLLSTAASRKPKPRSIALIAADEDDEDDDVDTNLKSLPGAGTEWAVGSGVKRKEPCKAIHPNVYDRPVPDRYLSPDPIPGSQEVYPEVPGKTSIADFDERVNKTGWGFGEKKPNITLPKDAGIPVDMDEPGVDGFVQVYEGDMNQTKISGLMPGMHYVFSVQAISDLGVSPESVYVAIQAKPTVPKRPAPPAMDRKGRNYMGISWTPARERGWKISGYIVQISDEKDAYGKEIWQNTCVQDWPLYKASGSDVMNYTTRPDERRERGLTEKDIQLDEEGNQMDFCKRRGPLTKVMPFNVSIDNMQYRLLQCCIDSLKPETTYSFRVAATSAHGISEWGPSAEMRTKGSPPLIPMTPRAESATPTSVTVMWTKPPAASSDQTDMTYYVEQYNHLDGKPVPVYSGNETSYTFEGIESGTEVKFRVQAENHNGRSPFSEYARVTTCATEVAQCDGVVTIQPESSSEDSAEENEIMLTQLAFDTKLRQRVSSNPKLLDESDHLTRHQHHHSTNHRHQ